MTKLRSIGRKRQRRSARARALLPRDRADLAARTPHAAGARRGAGALRKELIDSLGMERARGLLTRMGYASGLRDAELARTRAEDCSDLDAFMTGPQLHTLEGIVHVTPVRLELDRASGQLRRRIPLGEFLGRPMAPAPLRHPHRAGVLDADRLRLRLHLGLHGPADPVQGSRVRRHGAQQLPHRRQAGRGMGRRRRAHALLHAESIADQLIDLQTQVVQLRSRSPARTSCRPT